MTKAVGNLILMSLIVLTVTGLVMALGVNDAQSGFTDKSTVVLEDGKDRELSVKLSGLVPASSASYAVKLVGTKDDFLNVHVTFNKHGRSDLAEFVKVEIKMDGETIGSAMLSEYLNGKSADFKCEFEKNDHQKIEIVYSMGIDVGDEAQNTEAEFGIVFSATRQS